MMKKLTIIEFNEIVSENRSLIYVLNKIFGVGVYTAQKLVPKLGLAPFHLNKKLSQLPPSFKEKLSELLEDIELNFGSFYKKEVVDQLASLNEIKNLRSFKYLNGLPIRGQRTKTNARTSKRRVGRVRKSKVTKSNT